MTVVVLLAFLAMLQTGCVIALEVKHRPHHRQVIEIDGQLYVVDVRTNRVRKIDLIETQSAAETEAEPDED
jgi:hypothetical protein